MKMSIAGTRAAIGATMYSPYSTLRGTSGSLNRSFIPSATVCRIPYGPARIGPSRFCMSATILRSNQTRMMTVISTRANTATALIAASMNSAQPLMSHLPE